MGPLTFAQFKELGPFKSGEEPLGIVAADFSNRGILDVAVVNGISRNVAILQGNGDGTFSQHFKSGTIGLTPLDVAAADFNRDGFVDLALGLDDVVVHFGNGDGTFQKESLHSGDRTVPHHLVVADFNLDGNPDLATSSEGTGAVQVLLGTGQGTFQAQTVYRDLYTTRVMAADLNGDGYPDLAVSVFCNAQPNCPGGLVNIFLNRGDGSFGPPISYNVGTGAEGIGAGDFDGDGKVDLVVASVGLGGVGSLAVFHGNGDGTFRPLKNYTMIDPVCAVVVDDFDRDGTLDVIVTSPSLNRLDWFRGNGDGTFRGPVPLPTSGQPNDLAVGDYNGDGLPDLAVTLLSFNSTEVFINTSVGH